MNMEEFKSPGSEYRGVTLWMLNDRLEKEELRRQLRGFHEKGIGAVIGRTFMGLRTEYLSEEWMEHMHTIVDLAGELGMEVFFQAGYMPSGIPDQDPQYAHVALSSIEKGTDPEKGMTLLEEDDEFMYVESTKIHVLDMFNREAVDDYLKGAYEETWFANFRDEFGKTISSVWVDEPHFNPPHLPWGDVLKTEFEKEWGYRIEENIPALFTRVGDYRKIRHQYWRTVTGLLLNGYFNQVSEWCGRHGVSFSGHLMGEDTLAAQIAFTGACMPLYEKMQLPGIDHLTMSLNWSHWHRSREGDAWRFVMTPKQCSSAANQFGQKRILAEMYAVSSQGITFADRKQIADWFFIHGINYRCLHGSFYGMKGRRKRFYVPHLSHQQPWWEDNLLISEYCNRVSYTMHQGTFCADILVLHPVESAYCKFSSPRGEMHNPSGIGLDINEMNDSFAGLSERLMKIHRGFEYGDELIMSDKGSVEDGMLCIGNMKYRTVILPDLITLRQNTVDLLSAFLDAGGTVFSAGALPTRVEGEENEDLKKLTDRFVRVDNTEKALALALEKVCEPRISIGSDTGDASHVFMHERQLDDGRIVVFLANTSRDEDVSVSVRYAGEASFTELMPGDGSSHALPVSSGTYSSSVFSFAPLESHLLVLDPSEKPEIQEEGGAEPVQTAEITEWKVKRNAPNALTLDYCRLKKGEGGFSDLLPISALQKLLTEEEPYSGVITLQCEFDVESLPGSASLVIEENPEMTLRVNGSDVAFSPDGWFRDESFKTVEITSHLTEGKNILEVSMDFQPLEEPKFGLSKLFANIDGTEIENFRIIGDFAVSVRPSEKKALAEHVRYSPVFVITAESGETDGNLIESGYPFFCGEIELSAEFEVSSAVTETILSLPGLETVVAEVEVNGSEAGRLGWKPYEVDITDKLNEGANTVVVRLKNSLRNLLGPHHRPLIERNQDWGFHDYTGDYCPQTKKGYPKWYLNRSDDTDAWTEDYTFVKFGVYQPVKVLTR